VERTIGRDIGCRAIPHRSAGWRHGAILLIAMLCSAYIALSAGEARAQCTARDALRNHLALNKIPSTNLPPIPIRSAAAVPVWKTITLGKFASSFALIDALDAAGCSIGGAAGEILARPTFTLSTTKIDLELFVVSVAELGVQADTASLAEIYAHAQQLGFELAPAEVAPQLRLQYFDQPIEEFLTIGMKPIKTWSGEPVILNVANGGAGLIVIGQDGRADAQIPISCRFLFVRAVNTVSVQGWRG
jgi:hypothetical protein